MRYFVWERLVIISLGVLKGEMVTLGEIDAITGLVDKSKIGSVRIGRELKSSIKLFDEVRREIKGK